MQPIISVSGLTKTYASGHTALKTINLDIRKGEIFALLGPNGAGKTTLISIICGIVNPSTGTIVADGHDIVRDYRAARSKIGAMVRHGPHQPAQKSTITGMSLEATWRAKRAPVRATGLPWNSGSRQRPHLPALGSCSAVSLLIASQWGQTMCRNSLMPHQTSGTRPWVSRSPDG